MPTYPRVLQHPTHWVVSEFNVEPEGRYLYIPVPYIPTLPNSIPNVIHYVTDRIEMLYPLCTTLEVFELNSQEVDEWCAGDLSLGHLRRGWVSRTMQRT